MGIKEVDDGIWLVSFMDYDLGYIDLGEKTLQPLDNPFGPKVYYLSGTFCKRISPDRRKEFWWARQGLNQGPTETHRSSK